MAANPNVGLTLAGRAENVLLVRQALSGIADAAGLDAVELNDISTAVTEACNNVVLHAYGGEEGPLEVDFRASADGLDVLVGDRGSGIRHETRAGEEVSGGIGLPVIQALSESVSFSDRAGGGTLVEMSFRTARPPSLGEPAQPGEGDASEHAEQGIGPSEDRIVMTVAPASLAPAVLPRVLATLAARAYFSTDRISDAQSLADGLLSHLNGTASTGRLTFAIGVMPRNIELALGPLRSGGADQLFTTAAQDGLTPVLERLCVEHRVAPAGSAEMLSLQIIS